MEIINNILAFIMPLCITSFVLYFVMKAAVQSVVGEKFEELKKIIQNNVDSSEGKR